MATAAEQPECVHRAKRQHIDHSEDIVQLPYEILQAMFCILPTHVVLHHVGAVCKDWHTIIKDDELWRLRCGLSELPPGFDSWFAYAQRQAMREQALDHLYGRAGMTQNWRKGLQLLSVLADAGDDYAMALYGWALFDGVGIVHDRPRGLQLEQQSNNSMARAWRLLQQDHNAGFRMLNTECDTSDPHVQYMLGECHQYGYGCVENFAQAAQAYERSGNHVVALNILGSMFAGGFGAEEPDQARAAVLYRHAAEQGYVLAQLNIAWMYEYGNGVEQDFQQVLYWRTLANMALQETA